MHLRKLVLGILASFKFNPFAFRSFQTILASYFSQVNPRKLKGINDIRNVSPSKQKS